MKSKIILLTIGLLFLFVVWCWSNTEEVVKSNDSASQYCEDNWGSLEFTELPDWNELWTCFFVDGSFCDIRDYKNWSCKPWDNATWISKIITKCTGVECN